MMTMHENMLDMIIPCFVGRHGLICTTPPIPLSPRITWPFSLAPSAAASFTCFASSLSRYSRDCFAPLPSQPSHCTGSFSLAWVGLGWVVVLEQ